MLGLLNKKFLTEKLFQHTLAPRISRKQDHSSQTDLTRTLTLSVEVQDFQDSYQSAQGAFKIFQNSDNMRPNFIMCKFQNESQMFDSGNQFVCPRVFTDADVSAAFNPGSSICIGRDNLILDIGGILSQRTDTQSESKEALPPQPPRVLITGEAGTGNL